MRLCTIRTEAGPQPAVDVPGHGAVPTAALLGREAGDLMEHLAHGELDELADRVARYEPPAGGRAAPPRYEAPYRHPRKLLGIGLNYRAHAGDLGEQAPETSPASFLKADHTIIGPSERIVVPSGIGRVTAEAELGLVIGRTCYRVDEGDALSYVAGVCAVLDQTAESVLLENPRYLTRVKNYPTFFSFGPFVITMDEVLATVGDLADLAVTTVLNGEARHHDRVAGMTFSPARLLSFHSQVMPFYPGDILSTGTPGAVPIEPGDEVACELGGLMTLTNPVVGDERASAGG